MERIPETDHGHLAAGLARRGRVFAAARAAVGLLTFPSVAGASTHPASRMVPALASCGGVSADAVSSVVGFTVPAPTSAPIASHLVFSGIYEVGTYETLSKALKRKFVVHYLKSELAKSAAALPGGGKLTYKPTRKNGVEWVYAKVTATTPISETVQFEAAWQGTEFASVEVESALPKAEVTALGQLAADNAGISFPQPAPWRPPVPASSRSGDVGDVRLDIIGIAGALREVP